MKYAGKEKCEALKSIRKEIAEANGIAYAPHACQHEGDCPGTCPACEAEAEYLEREIVKKHGGWSKAKGAAAAAGIVLAAGVISSCSPYKNQVVGDVPMHIDSIEDRIVGKVPAPEDSIIELEGEVAIEVDSTQTTN